MTAPRPIIIGLTGSIAMGKSTVTQMFRDEGVPCFDADAAVHILQGPGGALVEAIELGFPGSTGPKGVNRQKLGNMVLGDMARLAELEAIIHPAVAQMRNEFLKEYEDAPVLLFDIPLLFEKGGHASVDAIVVVSAPPEEQRRRALTRDGMTVEKFTHILSLQTPDAEKRARADHVIDTGGNLVETRKQVRDILAQLRR
jgi:dephospho-CoA kinase